MKSAGNHCAPVVAVVPVVQRREGHDAGVEPGIAHVGDALTACRRTRAGDLDRVDPRPVRRVALELVPARDCALAQLLLAADDLEALQAAQ